jgi:4-amino-4-deoxy-L-arabinose transferase-like glycosyltransferase
LVAAVVLWLYRDVATLDVLVRAVLPVLWIGAWTLACLGAGVWPVRWLLGASPHQPAAVTLLAGAAVLAFVASLLASCGIFERTVLIVLFSAAVIEGVRTLVRRRPDLRFPAIRLVSAPALLLMAAGAATLVLTTAPPVMYDALNYHLAFPDHWLDAGGFSEFPRHVYSYYPSSQGLLYGFAVTVTGPWGAQAIHWWMGLMAVLTAATLGQRIAGREAATWAAACFGLTPVVLEIAGYAIADLAVAAWGGAALLVLIGVTERNIDWRTGALCGLLAGSAAAAKYLALASVMVPVAVTGIALLMWADRRLRAHRLLFVLAFAVASSVVLLPWLGRNVVWTSNPVYPYLQAVFGGPPAARDIAAEMGLTAWSPIGWLMGSLVAGISRTFHPLREAGLLGPHWLMLLPAAALARGIDRRAWKACWIAALIGTFMWGALVQYGRFLTPTLVPAAALAGTAVAALTATDKPWLRRLFRTLILFVLAWNATVIATDLNLDRARLVSGHARDAEHLQRWVSYAAVLPFVSEALPDDSRVMLVSESRSLYIDRPVLVEDPYRMPLLAELSRECEDAHELARRIRSAGATHLLINDAEMDRLARQRGASDYWDGTSPEERQLITTLLQDVVRFLYRSGGVWVAEVPDHHPPGG